MSPNLKIKLQSTVDTFFNRLIIIVSVIILLAFLYMMYVKLPYERQYFEKLGVNKYRYLYSEMVIDFGEPNDVIVQKDRGNTTRAEYNDFVMSFWTDSQDSYLTNIRIISDKYRFGWRSIGIGSTKEEVERAYKRIKKSPDPICAYVDGGIFIEFFFDENDLVKEMMISMY